MDDDTNDIIGAEGPASGAKSPFERPRESADQHR